jgi:hypothetical protein
MSWSRPWPRSTCIGGTYFRPGFGI